MYWTHLTSRRSQCSKIVSSQQLRQFAWTILRDAYTSSVCGGEPNGSEVNAAHVAYDRAFDVLASSAEALDRKHDQALTRALRKAQDRSTVSSCAPFRVQVTLCPAILRKFARRSNSAYISSEVGTMPWLASQNAFKIVKVV